jgi:uncharacterized RDD family membrane protein YckC
MPPSTNPDQPMQQVNDNPTLDPHTAEMNDTLTDTAAPDLSRAKAPGVLRRLATMLYDLLLVFGVLVVAAALFYTAFTMLTGNEAIAGPARPLFQLYLLSVILAYYVYFWSSGRQTLGMRAWRTRLLRMDGGPLTTMDALRRLLFATMTLAPAGLGLLWVLFDTDGLAWYDRLSGTRPVLTLKPGKGH